MSLVELTVIDSGLLCIAAPAARVARLQVTLLALWS